MIVGEWVADEKRNDDLGIKRRSAGGLKVTGGVEAELVGRRGQGSLVGHEVADATVDITDAPGQVRPEPVRGPNEKDDGYTPRRDAEGKIEDVRGDRTHEQSFPSRIRVIRACSTEAIRSSVAGSLPERSRSNDSISSAVFPVAQTMKIYPNLVS